jgi:hypothetical protein
MPMADNAPWWVSLIVSWLPFLLYWAIFWWFGRQIRKGLTTQDGRSLADVFAEIAQEMKRGNQK